MNLTPTLIQKLSDNFNDSEVQDLLLAIIAELKQDARKARNQEMRDFLIDLSEKVKDESFWWAVDYLNHFSFDY